MFAQGPPPPPPQLDATTREAALAEWDKETRTITVDVKGAYVQQDRREEFNLKRHAVYSICKVLVREIDPAKLFALTWVPRASAFQKVRGGRCAAPRPV